MEKWNLDEMSGEGSYEAKDLSEMGSIDGNN